MRSRSSRQDCLLQMWIWKRERRWKQDQGTRDLKVFARQSASPASRAFRVSSAPGQLPPELSSYVSFPLGFKFSFSVSSSTIFNSSERRKLFSSVNHRSYVLPLRKELPIINANMRDFGQLLHLDDTHSPLVPGTRNVVRRIRRLGDHYLPRSRVQNRRQNQAKRSAKIISLVLQCLSLALKTLRQLDEIQSCHCAEGLSYSCRYVPHDDPCIRGRERASYCAFFVVSLSILLLAGISLSALFDEERILDKSLLCSGLGEDRGWLLAPNHAHTTFNERLSHEIEDAFVSARCYALSRGCSCERCGCISGLVLTSPYCLHIPLPLHASSPTVLRVPVLKCSGYCLGRDRLPLLLPTMSGAQVSPLLEREVQGN